MGSLQKQKNMESDQNTFIVSLVLSNSRNGQVDGPSGLLAAG